MSSTIVANGSSLDLSGIISFDTIEVQGTSSNTDLVLTASATLNNAGTILLDGADSRILGNSGSANALDNVNGTIEGAGQIGVNNGGLNLSLINEAAGTIDADSTLQLGLFLAGSPAATNAGLMEATSTGGLLIQNAVIDNFIGTQAGTIAATGTGAVVTLQNSEVAGGTLESSGGGLIASAGGTSTLDGSTTSVTITTGSTVQVTDNSTLFLNGAIANSGTILNATTGDTTDIRIAGGNTVTLSGGGVVDLAGANARIFGSSGTPGTLDNVNNTIEGAGQIGINNGGLQLALLNAAGGTIEANATSALVLGLAGGPAGLNAGLMEALGTSELAIQNGAITNLIGTTVGTIAATGTSAVVSLQNSDIAGGTLSTSGGGLIETAPGTGNNTLDGSGTTPIAISAGSTVELVDNSSLFLNGTIANAGTILEATTGDATDIRIGGGSTVTLNGGGVVDLGGPNARIFGTSSTIATLDNVNDTIEGAGQIGINNGGLALALINAATGIIDANGTASMVIALGGPTLSNDGLIEDTGTGGLVITDNTEIDNTGGGTVLAKGTGAFMQLSSGTFLGGTLSTSNGGLIDTAPGTSNTIDGSITPVTITTASTVQVTDNSTLFLNGTIANAGTILNATTGDNTDIRIAGGNTVTLNGGGVVDLAGPNARIFGTSSTIATLDNVNDTIEGAGQIGVNNGGLALALINEAGGTVDANGATALVIQTGGPVVQNAGLIEETGTTTLAINSLIDNFIGTRIGTIAAIGTHAAVQLSNGTLAGGTLSTSGGGVIETAPGTGSNTLDGSGTTPINITAGSTVELVDNSTLFLNGTIASAGTILNAATGDNTDLRINGGSTVTLSGASVVDLAGPNARIFGTSGTAAVLDNFGTIEGAGQIGVNNSGLALALINEAGGTIDANGASPLSIQTGGPVVQNAGLIEETGTTTLVINNIIDNFIGTHIGTIAATGTNAVVQLSNGTLAGGTLSTSGGGLIETALGTGSNTLDGSGATPTNITAGSTVELVDNSSLFLNGTIASAGTILDATTGDNTDIRISGGSTVTLGSASVVDLGGPNARIFGTSGTPATLDNFGTIEGAGQIGVNNSGLALALINEAGGTIDATGTATLFIQPGGPAVSNAGLMEGSGSGGLRVIGAALTNTGTIQALDGSNVTFDTNVVTNNNSAGTLTGGNWGAYSTGDGAHLDITGGSIGVDAATIVLSGTGSTFDAFNGSTYEAIDQSLTSIAVGGTLEVLADRNFTTANTITDSGLLDLGGGLFTSTGLDIGATGTLAGFGTVSDSLVIWDTVNNGTIEATVSGTTLLINTTLTGTGELLVDPGATLELGRAVASTETLVVDPRGTVKIDDPSAYTTGTVSGLDPGATFDFGTTLVTSAAIVGGSLEITLAGGTSLDYALVNPDPLDRTAIIANGQSGDNVVIYREAQATIGPNPVTIANQHVSGPLNANAAPITTALTISNSDTADGFSENLDASITPVPNAVASGSFAGLAAGATNDTSLLLGVSNTLAGTISGVGLVSLSSDGTGIDGNGTLALVTGEVPVSGNVYNYATAAAVTPNPIALGQHHTGDTLTQALTIANTAPAGSFSENLDAGFTSASTGIATGGTVSALAAGTSSSALNVTIDLASAGSFAGSATIADTSDGGTIDGLGTTALAPQTIAANAVVFNLATAAVTPNSIDFGKHHVGATLAQTLTIANTAPVGAFSENLDASLSGASGGIVTNGSTIAELAAGSSSSAFGVTLDTRASGVVTGAATIGLISDGSTIDTLGTTVLGSDTVDVSGTLYNLATASAAAPNPIALGEQHVGQTLTQALTISNTATANGFSENLDAGFGSATSGIIGGGTIGELAAGSASAGLIATIELANAGSFAGSATIADTSDGSTIDGLGTTGLGSQTVDVSATAFRLAAPLEAPNPIAFGQAHVRDTVSQALTIANTDAADGLSENLDANIGGATGITTSGSISELGAGNTSTALSATLDTANAGSISGTATIGLISDGSTIDTLGTTALTPETIDASGTVFRLATALLPGSLDFGIHHVRDTVAQAITVANTATNDGFSENLDAAAGTAATGFTLSGSAGEIGAGVSSTALTATLDTATAGIFGGNGTIGLTSDGSTIDTLGTTALPNGVIALSGTVLNFATAGFDEISGGGTLTHPNGTSYTLDLGTLAVGGTADAVDLGVLNSAIGPADTVAGSFDSSGSGFGLTGFGPFSGVTAGNSIGAGTISFDPSSAGTFFETITLDPTGFDPSFSAPLAPETFLVEADVPCFARGTRIATGGGVVAVEDLRVGDAVLSAAGALRPVVWIGDRKIDCRRHPLPARVRPVRVRAGAFGKNLPQRDLLLSPDHAVFADGVLIPAKHLVNGATVVQDSTASVHYFHIELASHDVLLAEGLAVESYLDTGNRAAFANDARHMMLHPDFSPLSWDDAFAPLCTDGPVVFALRRRMVEHMVQALGFHVMAAGRAVRPAAAKGWLCRFLLPAGTREVRIVSRADFGTPARGIGIGGIHVGGAPVPLQSPALAEGFHALEQDGAERWRPTDGDALLTLPKASGRATVLELLLRDPMRPCRSATALPDAA